MKLLLLKKTCLINLARTYFRTSLSFRLFLSYAVYVPKAVKTTLKIMSQELMILLVMSFNAICFTSYISPLVTYVSSFLYNIRMF